MCRSPPPRSSAAFQRRAWVVLRVWIARAQERARVEVGSYKGSVAQKTPASFARLLGDNPSPALINALSVELHVRADTPARTRTGH